MSDLLSGRPCNYCGSYYGHKGTCFNNSLTGVAEKIMFQEVSAQHNHIVYKLERKLAEAEEILRFIDDTETHMEGCYDERYSKCQCMDRTIYNRTAYLNKVGDYLSANRPASNE